MNPSRSHLPSVLLGSIRYVPSLVLAGGASIVPFLAKLPLLELFPAESEAFLRPTSAVVMGLAAVLVQLHFGDQILPGSVRRRFYVAVPVAVLAFAMLSILCTDYILPMKEPRTGRSMPHILGWSRLPEGERCTCKPPPEETDEECAWAVGLKFLEVCWPTIPEVRRSLHASYLTFAGALGALMGLPWLQWEARRQQMERQESKAGLPLLQEKVAAVQDRALPPKVSDGPHDLFLSYANEDVDFVKRLVADLFHRGYIIWWAQSKVGAGYSLFASINKGLDTSRQFAVVLSPSSVRSRWVNREIGAAVGIEGELLEQKEGMQVPFIIPILYRQCEVPALLKDLIRADFTGPYEQGLAEVLHQLLPPSGSLQSA